MWNWLLKKGICCLLVIRMWLVLAEPRGGFCLPLSKRKRLKEMMWMRNGLRSIGTRLKLSWQTSVMMLWEWLMNILYLRLQLVNQLCFIIRCKQSCFILDYGFWCYISVILHKLIVGCLNVLLAGKEIIIVTLRNLRLAMRRRRLVISQWKHMRWDIYLSCFCSLYVICTWVDLMGDLFSEIVKNTIDHY